MLKTLPEQCFVILLNTMQQIQHFAAKKLKKFCQNFSNTYKTEYK